MASDSASNPFRSPGEAPEDDRHSGVARLASLALAVASAIAAPSAAVMALFFWAFGTMVDPQVRGEGRVREIIDRFFFRDGPLLGLIIFAMTWLAAVATVATATYLFAAVAGFPGLRTSTLFALIGGSILALVAFAALIVAG